jgi:hypothetical protein
MSDHHNQCKSAKLYRALRGKVASNGANRTTLPHFTDLYRIGLRGKVGVAKWWNYIEIERRERVYRLYLSTPLAMRVRTREGGCGKEVAVKGCCAAHIALPATCIHRAGPTGQSPLRCMERDGQIPLHDTNTAAGAVLMGGPIARGSRANGRPNRPEEARERFLPGFREGFWPREQRRDPTEFRSGVRAQ